MEQQVILFNGPSSSGKSTLAKALQKIISDNGQHYEVVSIDDFMKVSPMETIYEDDVFEISDDMNQKALSLLAAGSGVIIDHVMTSERIFVRLKEALSAYPLRLVRIRCPLEVLIERERARGDRCPGSAEASDKYLFPREGYDLAVDTGDTPLTVNAMRIYRAFF